MEYIENVIMNNCKEMVIVFLKVVYLDSLHLFWKKGWIRVGLY